MKWTYSIKNKMTAATVLFILCLVILLNTLNNLQNQSQVKMAINTMYDDRLVVESYILKLSSCMYHVDEVADNAALSASEVDAEIAKIMSAVNSINADYERTKFTALETEKYQQFKMLSSFIGSSSGKYNMQEKRKFSKQALQVLNELSAIQIAESRTILAESEKIFSSGKMSSRFEFALVIVIGLVLQSLVFASRSIRSRVVPAKPQLN